MYPNICFGHIFAHLKIAKITSKSPNCFFVMWKKNKICLPGVTSKDGNGLKTANSHDIYHINWSEKSNSKFARRSYFCFFLNWPFVGEISEFSICDIKGSIHTWTSLKSGNFTMIPKKTFLNRKARSTCIFRKRFFHLRICVFLSAPPSPGPWGSRLPL